MSRNNCRTFLGHRGIISTDLIGSLVQRVRDLIVSGPTYRRHRRGWEAREWVWVLPASLAYAPSLPEIACAASLAHHGLLGSISEVWLKDVNLTSVPAQHLASLASYVTKCVTIENVSGCDLVTILDSLNCQVLRSSILIITIKSYFQSVLISTSRFIAFWHLSS